MLPGRRRGVHPVIALSAPTALAGVTLADLEWRPDFTPEEHRRWLQIAWAILDTHQRILPDVPLPDAPLPVEPPAPAPEVVERARKRLEEIRRQRAERQRFTTRTPVSLVLQRWGLAPPPAWPLPGDLGRARRSAGLSQRELAQRAGMSRSYVHALEQPDWSAGPAAAEARRRLAGILGLTPQAPSFQHLRQSPLKEQSA